MTRDTYYSERRNARAQQMPRAERGLPRHPDGSGLARCACFEGCALCNGTCYLDDGHRDPLLRLRYARQAWVRRQNPSMYRHLRELCAVPVYQLRLIEACVGCGIATDSAVQAWRDAA